MRHIMNREEVYPTGAERWGCPSCGRQIVFRFLPFKLKNIVLREGDPYALHSGFISPILKPALPEEGEDDLPPGLKSQLGDILDDIKFQVKILLRSY